MDKPDNHAYCFGCGADNPCGLKLNFKMEGSEITARFTPRAEHQGFGGIMHGGIVSALLDEAMGYAVGSQIGEVAYTVALDVRFKAHLNLQDTAVVKARVDTKKGRLIVGSAELTNEKSSEIIAMATGKFLKPKKTVPEV